MTRPSLKKRLTVGFTVAILITALATTVIGVTMIRQLVYTQAQSKVNSDLESAKEIYQGYAERLKDALRIHATRMVVYRALDARDPSLLGAEMERIRKAEKLDILTLVDPAGKVFYRTANPAVRGDSQAEDQIVRGVLQDRTPFAGSVIIPAPELRKESETLVRQAFMEITPTPHAAPTTRTSISDGLALKGAAPVFTADNRMVGVLYGAFLISRNYEIVDRIRKTVFKEGVYDGRPAGTSTIFQDDVRVSTNVRNQDGSRAITTRASEEVVESVLRRGTTWQGSAFVVNDWYISAYAPIKSATGATVGMLYVGILERPYGDMLVRSLLVFLGVALMGVVVAILGGVIVSQRISKPIQAMAAATHRLAEGDYSSRVEVTSGDEIGRLADSFNRMSDELARTHQELRQWAAELERKVEQRTSELKAMQDQLVHTEKLAALGKLAAGVAHEINNPLTGILTNSSLMLEDTPEGDPRRPDLQTVVDETLRCRKIVKGLLDFARQTPPQKHLLNMNDVVEDVLSLVRNQAGFRNIAIQTSLDTAPCIVMADRDQMRQVVLNIVLNAAEAMGGVGELRIRSAVNPKTRRVHVRIQDTGPGFPEEIKYKVFEPFFTTKQTGTGLGLSIAYGILERHGGGISLESVPGRGATVSVWLPLRNDQIHG